jgi:oxalate decarboxylase
METEQIVLVTIMQQQQKISNMSHKFNLDGTPPQVANTMGSRTMVDSTVFPTLEGMAIGLVILKKEGVREPHWHPNASELGYCVSGKTAMTIFSPGNGYDRFTIEAGDLSYVPIDYIHDIENIGDTDAKFLEVFNNEKPEDLGISRSIGSMQNRVLNATFSY